MASECWLSTRPEMIAKIFDLNDVIALPSCGSQSVMATSKSFSTIAKKEPRAV